MPGTIIPNHKLGGGGNTTQVKRSTISVANVTVNAAGGRAEDNQDLAAKVGRAVQDSMRSMVAGELRMQLRPGGILSP